MSDILQSGSRSPATPSLFAALPERLQGQLRSGAPLTRFAEGQLIQQRGDAPAGFWLLEQGSVAVGQFLRSGDFRGVAMLGPGDSWGELALFADRPRVVDALARTPCELRHIRKADLEALLENNPTCMRAMLGLLSQQLQEVLDIVGGIRRGTATARVAGMLATMAGDGVNCARITIAQHELGELLGLTRATVNAALKHYENQGLIRRFYGGVEVLDREALALAALD